MEQITIKEAITRVDKSEANLDYCSYGVVGEFGYDISEIDRVKLGTALKCYWLFPRNSTDTLVGYRAYYFNDEPVAFSFQTGRKEDEEFFWVSFDAFEKVQQFAESCLEERDRHFRCSLMDDSMTIPLEPHVNFPSEICREKAMYDGRPVRVNLRHARHVKWDAKEVPVTFLSTGVNAMVSLDDLTFPLHLEKVGTND